MLIAYPSKVNRAGYTGNAKKIVDQQLTIPEFVKGWYVETF